MSSEEKETPVRVRFAPSPTGSLHIGGARTALYNWLFAKNQGGEFVLRIEDTDRERSSEEKANEILSNLRWLGLDWDGEVKYQSRNLDRYREIAWELLEREKAFQCFCKKPELDEGQNRNKRAPENQGQAGDDQTRCDCYLLTVKEIEARIQNGDKPAIRFWVPPGSTCYDDLVYGSIEVDHAEIDHFIILRDDETPTYHLAVVADDFDMDITHVIRGDDHISNTPKQVLLYLALDWQMPEFAHLPLILGPDKKRLSKRHGAASISEYAKSGILSEALLNYLALLGWSPGGDREVMTKTELVELFSLQRVARKSAVFDSVKLEWVNSEHIKEINTDSLMRLVLPYLKDSNLITEEEMHNRTDYLSAVMELFKPRMKTLKDLARYGKYFFQDPEKYDGSALKKYWSAETKGYLAQLNTDLIAVEEFNATEIEAVLRNTASTIGIQAAKLIHPMRIVLTGYSVSPGLFDMMEVLGKEVVARRIENGINVI